MPQRNNQQTNPARTNKRDKRQESPMYRLDSKLPAPLQNHVDSLIHIAIDSNKNNCADDALIKTPNQNDMST